MLGKRLAVGVTLQRRNHAFPHEENASEPVLDAFEFDGHLAPGHVGWTSSWSARWNDEVHEETHARQLHRTYRGLGYCSLSQAHLGLSPARIRGITCEQSSRSGRGASSRVSVFGQQLPEITARSWN
jgi:hypothetical protein